MKIINFVLLGLISLLLVGCLGSITPPATSSYVLNATPAVITKRHSTNNVLLVLLPDTRPAYNTTQMAYTTKPYQISYFGLNQWAETPAQMLQPLLVQTIQNTHYFRAVMGAPYTGHADYVLQTQILKLQQDYTRCPTLVEFTVRADVLQPATNQLIATQMFYAEVPIMQRTPYSGVIAANQATAELLQQIAIFTMNHAK